MPTTYAIAAEQIVGTDISYTAFNPCSTTGDYIWDSLKKSGSLPNELATSEELGIAVSCRFAVPALSFKCSTFSLVWFMPVVHFGGKSRSYKRWYTRYVGEESGSIEKLVDSALIEGENWRLEIEKWQEPVINDKSLPEWYKSALFNELYYVVDGAAFWFEYDSSWKDIEKINPITEKQLRKFGRFGYMESWEYLMINTYDVHFYASWAFVKNWPQLELSIQLEFYSLVRLAFKGSSHKEYHVPAAGCKESARIHIFVNTLTWDLSPVSDMKKVEYLYVPPPFSPACSSTTDFTSLFLLEGLFS
ncbi:hypothetical protein Y032_0002g788 [Ancylostoma ceylanicum]|nr:hypothetical protein Y032_0002g788 [Ancylostoma ceylanicum]